MIQKSIATGIIVGLALTLLGLYPAFIMLDLMEVLPFNILPFGRLSWEVRLGVEFAIFAVFTGLFTLALLTVGSAAAWRTRATSFKDGLYAGVMSGAAAGLILYVMLVAPTLAVHAAREMWRFELSAAYPHYPEPMVTALAQRAEQLYLPLIIGAAGLGIGGIEGGLTGWLRRKSPASPQPASLLQAIENKRNRKVWLEAFDDEVVKAGLLTGLAGGLFIAITVLQGGMASPWAWSGNPALWSIVLSPLLFLVNISVGGVAAFLLKNPASRFRARVHAAMLAGALVGVIASIQRADELRVVLAILPQFVIESGAAATAAAVSAFLPVAARIVLMYLLPPLFIGAMALGWMLIGLLQGLGYGLIMMALQLRPVDRAHGVLRDIAQTSDQFLLRLYRLFQTDDRAVQVLEHVALNMKGDPLKARVTAAYHTLATCPPTRATEALEIIAQTLSEQPTWKLQGEVGALHALIAQGLRASTVAQIADLAPMPEDQTTSLPPLLAKAGDHLTRILSELKKVERVDDLNSKIIFLNNTLESLHLAQIFCQEGAMCKEACSTPYPEFNALQPLLDQWESIVLSTIKDIQGCADLAVELKTRRLTFAPRLTLILTLANRGLNVAEDVRLHVWDGDGEYVVVEGGRQTIDILPPQESRELAFVVKPRNTSRLRLAWQITYDDALNDDRVLEFGDLVEFIEPPGQFQRIFPIPYVTGTPLQSGQMFVGRQDVFDFVREHLLGVYQNNVIVLHGQRRTGKTSILYRLNDVLADTHVCVLIDMQGKAARGEVEFLYSIADDIVYTLENKGIAVSLPSRHEFQESPEFFFRSRFLRSVYQALGGKNLLLMFDEFEELQRRVQDGKLTPDIFPYLRNLMQHERQVDFIFAGTHKLEELAAEYWSILFNIAAYKRITFLTPDEVTRLVTQPVAPYGMEYDPLAVERIYQVAAGHPYFTQVICHEMVAYHNETQRSYLTTTDVDAALSHIIERGEAHFKYIWAESSTPQRLTLLALAELLEADDAVLADDVAALLQKRGRPLGESDLAEALANLEARDIVMRSGPRSNLYRFRVDLIRRWIYAARPAYEKVV